MWVYVRERERERERERDKQRRMKESHTYRNLPDPTAFIKDNQSRLKDHV